MIIMHNMLADFTNRSLGIRNKALAKNAEKLSSGYRINRAADDAAGLAISEEMRGQIRGLNRSAQNIDEGINFCQVGDGAMQELENIIHRIRQLSVQAANDTYTDEDRTTIQYEVDALNVEVNRITSDTEYNTIKVFGKSRQRTEYEEVSGTKLVPKDTVVYEITGKNYGITEILGVDHVYQGDKMDSPVDFLGSGWHNTGADAEIEYYTVNKDDSIIDDIDAYMMAEHGIYINKKSNDVTETIPSITDRKTEITFKYGVFNEKGERLLTSMDITTYDKDVLDPTKTKISNIVLSGSYGDSCGTKGMGYSTQYYGAWVDFSGLGTDYDVGSLYGQGVNTGCKHCSGRNRYNIKFTGDTCAKTNADGVNYNYKSDGPIHTLEINLTGCVTGDDVVSRIMSAANSERDFTSHYIQLAYNDSEKSKLYFYDDWPEYRSSEFEPATREDKNTVSGGGVVWVRVPNTVIRYKYEDCELNIQAGSNARQLIELKRPYLNASVLGVSLLNLTTQETAGYAIECCDIALGILNGERSSMGALSNRFEHAYNGNTNTSENLQASESRLRDLDVADEMVDFSANQIIKQAAEAMLSQANSSKNGILGLLQG